ncbi:MAG: S1 RNA-binding domain-containing protein [Gemmataceae bacterium]|nr:S1 RNA-binding domain-containing protein [Gemmataceae bacterium]
MDNPTNPTPPAPTPSPEATAAPAAQGADAPRSGAQNPGVHTPGSPDATAKPALPSGSPAADGKPKLPPDAFFRRPQPGGPRPGGSDRPFPKGDKPFVRSDKPLNPGGMSQQLDRKEFGALKPNNRELDKLIEDEMAAAMAGFDVSATVAQAENQQKPQAPKGPGGRKVGVIVGIHGKDVFVEVPGGRSQGVLPLQQFEGRTPVVGEAVEFDIERYDAANGLLVLTREGSAQVVTDWSQVQIGMIVEAKVTGTNKNKTGLTVEVAGIKGFLPASQLDMYRVEDIEQFVNQRLKVMVAEVDPSERNLIVSRRALLERERQVKAEEFWRTVEEGQVKKGIVRSIKPFGVFVDLGGADGLIPMGELAWGRVEDANSLFKIGDSVEVMIQRVDREARKIGLSLRAMTKSPWEDFAGRIKAGARVNGKVTRTTDFGAFVEVEPGIEGLIHISELSNQRVRRVRDVVDVGQPVEVEVLSVDTEARRMALSLKAIKRAEEVAAEEAEEEELLADRQSAAEALANRPFNPNLRGGI